MLAEMSLFQDLAAVLSYILKILSFSLILAPTRDAARAGLLCRRVIPTSSSWKKYSQKFLGGNPTNFIYCVPENYVRPGPGTCPLELGLFSVHRAFLKPLRPTVNERAVVSLKKYSLVNSMLSEMKMAL